MLDLHEISELDVKDQLLNIRIYQKDGEQSLHKPLLLLIALGNIIKRKPRLIPFREYDLFLEFMLDKHSSSKFKNTHYPFGKLENDGIWELENSSVLKRTSAGHLYKSELIEKEISGGFTEKIYKKLTENKFLTLEILHCLIIKFFPQKQHQDLLDIPISYRFFADAPRCHRL